MTFEVVEYPFHDEYYGKMTYIRVPSVGEHVQDNKGLVLWLNGLYPTELLERITTVLKEGDGPTDV